MTNSFFSKKHFFYSNQFVIDWIQTLAPEDLHFVLIKFSDQNSSFYYSACEYLTLIELNLNVFVSLSMHNTISLFVFLSFLISQSVCLSVCLFVCISLCLFIWFFLSVCLFEYLSVYLCYYFTVYQYVFLNVYLSVCVFVDLFV